MTQEPDQKDDLFEVCGETFSKKHFPHLYLMNMTNEEHLKQTLRSVADRWHNGDIVAAAQGFESDLGHVG